MNFLTEMEQVDSIKRWINNYGVYLLVILLMGLVIFLFSRWFYQRNLQIKVDASGVYQHLLQSVEGNDINAMKNQANELMNRYPKTVYSDLAALQLAKIALHGNQIKEAIEQLQRVSEKTRFHTLRAIASIRLARLQISQKEYKAAFSRLDSVQDQGFQPLVNVVKGDAWYAQGQLKQAKKAYQEALKNSEAIPLIEPIIRMKVSGI